MIDTSDAAIEADLSRAESGGTPGMIAMLVGRAQIRATLQAARAAGRPSFQALPAEGGSLDIQIALGPFGDSYAVPAGAAWEDRVEAAARMLGLDVEPFHGLLLAAFGPEGVPSGLSDVPPGPEDVPLEAPADPDFELDVEDDDGSLEDAHIEAGGTLDDLDEATVDEDFFADVKKARKR